MRILVLLLASAHAYAECRVTQPAVHSFDCGGSVAFQEGTFCIDESNGNCLNAFVSVGIAANMMFIPKVKFPCVVVDNSCDCRNTNEEIPAYCASLSCGGGACEVGDKCCNGRCIPSNHTCCDDGSSCPGACAGNGQCCGHGLPVFDRNTGYCCGQTDPNNTSTVCICANECPAIQGCCPAGKVCCDRGWCADSAGDCPSCPASAPTFCNDGTCAPAGAVCCGNGIFCPNGLSCVDAGGGVIKCGSARSNPDLTVAPTSSGSPPTRAGVEPDSTPTPGKAPSGGSTSSSTGSTTSAVNPLTPPGCKCDVGQRAPTTPLVLLVFIAVAGWRLRRVR
jgi:hypothetical protein